MAYFVLETKSHGFYEKKKKGVWQFIFICFQQQQQKNK